MFIKEVDEAQADRVADVDRPIVFGFVRELIGSRHFSYHIIFISFHRSYFDALKLPKL